MNSSRKAARGSRRRKTRRCPTGTILRNPYVRKSTFVPASCIKDVGNPGKGLASGEPGIGPLKHGDLSRFGYDHVVGMRLRDRRTALAQAQAAYGSLTLWRKLNAVSIYTRNTAPSSSKIFKADRDWVRATYGIKATQ